MSTRWMAVQYIGDILRIPVVNESDMDMPFGSSTLERDVRRIVVNPFSDSPQVFVPEAENAKLRTQLADVTESMGRVEERCAKLRELAGELWTYAEQELVCDDNCPYGDTCDWMETAVVCVFKRRMRELGVEVDV